MEASLHATLTKTYRGEPLAVVDGLPGGGAELTPADLRALAATLVRIAAECDARPVLGKRALPSVRREYPLTT